MFNVGLSRGRFWRPDGTEITGSVVEAATALIPNRPCDFCGGDGEIVLLCTEDVEGKLYIASTCVPCAKDESNDFGEAVLRLMGRAYVFRDKLPSMKYEKGLVLRLASYGESTIKKILGDRPVKIEGQMAIFTDPEQVYFTRNGRTYFFFREFKEITVVEMQEDWTDKMITHGSAASWDDYHHIVETIMNPGIAPHVKNWAEELTAGRIGSGKKSQTSSLLSAITVLGYLLSPPDENCNCDLCRSKREAMQRSGQPS